VLEGTLGAQMNLDIDTSVENDGIIAAVLAEEEDHDFALKREKGSRPPIFLCAPARELESSLATRTWVGRLQQGLGPVADIPPLRCC
jgi:hypothetical protein